MSLAHSPRIVTDGLVLAVDAANPKSYPGSGTVLSDMSKSNFDGTIVGSPAYANGALTFDAPSKHVDFGFNVVTSAFTGLTVEVLLKTTTRSVELIFEDGSDYSTNAFYLAKENSNSITFEVFGQGAYDVIYSSAVYPINEWLHVTGTWVSGSRTKIYFNGLNTDGAAAGSARTTINTGNTTLQLGRRPGGSLGFNGDIAIARIYNRGLTAAEVLTNFNATRGRFGL